MRITESLKYTNITSQLGQLRQRYNDAVTQSSSGKRVNAPSDDPIAAAQNVRIQASMGDNDAFRKTIATVKGDAELTESALDSAGQVLQRAIELAMSGANESTSAEQYKALSTEAQQLLQTMIGLGNSKGVNGYLFAGTLTDQKPFSDAGQFSGNDDVREISIDGGPLAAVTVSGRTAFADPGGRDVMQDLQSLTTALTAGDAQAVQVALDNIQSSHTQVVTARAQAGLIMDRLTLTDNFLNQTNTNLASESSTLTDADTAAVFSTLSQLQTTIQQTVAVDQKLLQTTATTLTP